MSTGRRLAKRSIIGTKVCAKGPDGLWYSGTISDVKTPPSYMGPLSPPPPPTFLAPGEAQLNADTRYMVRFDFKTAVESPVASTSSPSSSSSSSSISSTDPSVIVEARRVASVHHSPAQALRRSAMIKEFRESDLIGPGFRSIMDTELQPGQRVYFTYNGREQSGDVVEHDATKDEVTVKITTVGNEEPIELKKRLEEVRLLESRRSARLADQDRDTDFARLADMSGERRRTTTHSIEVPSQLTAQHNARKRPASDHQDYSSDPNKDEETCRAAEILSSMKLQSPHGAMADKCSSPGSSSSASWSSGSASPPLSDDGHAHHSPHIIMSPHDAANARIRTTSVSTSDEGIVIDFKEERKKKSKKFRCVYPGCHNVEHEQNKIVRHIRKTHLGKKNRRSADDDCENEEEFYYTDVDDDDEQVKPSLASEPTLSHRDMARPPHEDPEYQKQIVGNFKQGRAGSHYNHLAQPHGRTISGSNIPSTHQQQLQNNNTSCIPTSHLAHHNYTWPAAAAVGSNSSAGTGLAAASSSASPLGKHARSSSTRPSHSVAPYPSPMYVQQQQHHSNSNVSNHHNNHHTHHHNYAGSSGNSSSNSSSSSPVIHSNSSANNMLQQLSQQNVTVTAHHSQQQQQQQLQQQQHHHQQHHQQQQQHLLSSVTITPNFHPAQQQQHQQQQQHHQPMRGQQQQHQQHPQTTAGNLVAHNNNNNNSNGSNPMQQQHMAPQAAVKQTPHSPGKRTRGENKKCRKVYGMEKRDQWCTQCRWKKACSRFGD
uniref:Zinc finger protein 395 isoform X2 n=1 Tax=Drosophila rhopaloa TaxID=1041015 RepID=A0A6P4FJV3_DRORH